MRFGASKCISERPNAFRSVKSTFRSVGVGGDLLRFEFRIGGGKNPLSIPKTRVSPMSHQ